MQGAANPKPIRASLLSSCYAEQTMNDAAAKTVDFYWDIGSTNTYFALHLIKPIVARHGARLVMHPFNLGYVFRHHNYRLMEEPPAKLRNRGRDLVRWAERHDLAFRMPDVFPIKTSRALRGALAMRVWNKEMDYIDALFQRYWEQNDAGVADYPVLRELAVSLGVDADAFEARAESEPIRSALIDTTNRALEIGVFGAPSFLIDGELYWGKDRMEFVEDALRT